MRLIKLDPNTAEIRVCKNRGESNADLLTAWFKKKAIWFKWKQSCHYAWVRFFYKIKSVQKCVSAWFSVQTSFRCKASSLKKERERGGGVWYLGLPCGVMQSRSLSLSHFLTSHFTTSTQRIELYAAAVLPSGLFFLSFVFSPTRRRPITNNLNSARGWGQLPDLIYHYVPVPIGW